MTPDFADTSYWIALMNPNDTLHRQAKTLSESHTKLITTQEVLSEFLTFFCGRGEIWRQTAIRIVNQIQTNSNITVIKETPESFSRGMKFYEKRLDKQYSLPDCISMVTMQDRKLSQVLTHDHHFSQEGFKVLMTLPK